MNVEDGTGKMNGDGGARCPVCATEGFGPTESAPGASRCVLPACPASVPFVPTVDEVARRRAARDAAPDMVTWTPADLEVVLDAPPPRRAEPTKLRSGWYCRSCFKDSLKEIAPNVWHCTECKANKETPPWMVRRDASGQYTEWEFGRRFVQDLTHALRASRDPEATFQERAAQRGVPPELWDALMTKVRELQQPEEIIMDGARRIVFSPEGVFLETERRGPTLVIAAPFEVRRVVHIEGERRILVKDALGEFGGTPDQIIQRLKDNAQVLSSKDVVDLVSHIIHRCTNRGEACYTYGVYADGDRLHLPKEYLPKEGDQRDVLERLQPFLDVAPTAQEWQDWETFFGFFEPAERYAVAGLAAIAPFALVLRKRRQIVPFAYLYSREGGSGKSKMVEALTARLWTTGTESAKALNSPFRQDHMFDMVALPWGFDEAEKFDWDQHGASFKQSMESEFTGRRGTAKLTTVRYRSRLVPLMTANTLPAGSATVLRRAVVPHFNEERKNLSPASKRAFDEALERLRVVGPALTRAGLDACEASERALVKILRGHEDAINDHYLRAHGPFVEAGRASVWAVAYWGLTVWHRASGGAVSLPTIADFCDLVVKPAEDTANESALDALAKLRNFIVQWMSRNSRPENQAGMVHHFYWTERSLAGHHITNAMLDAYNKENARTPEATIPTLRELGRMVARKYRIPEAELLPGGQAARVAWGGTQHRVVFVPSDEPNPQTGLGLASADGHGGDGTGPGTNGHAVVRLVEGPLGQAGRAQQIVELVRSLQGDTGVLEDVLVATAQDRGIPRSSTAQVLRQLQETGKVFSPEWGRFAVR
jgi:hypothetical protein